MPTAAADVSILTTVRQCEIATRIGELTAVRSDDGLLGLYFTTTAPAPIAAPSDPAAHHPTSRISPHYLAGRRTDFDLPLAAAFTPTAAHLRQRMLALPYGPTTTYGALAQDLGTCLKCGGPAQRPRSNVAAHPRKRHPSVTPNRRACRRM